MIIKLELIHKQENQNSIGGTRRSNNNNNSKNKNRYKIKN
jgi:hypothetical protein